MDLVKCEAFLTAAEYGSITRAAKELGYTQPGITRQIHSLESELGFRLLVRTKRGVELTANGRDMLPAMRAAAQALRAAEEQGAEICGMLSGTLTVSSYYSTGALWLPQVLARLSHEHPSVRVILRQGTNAEIARWLTERSVDCSVSAVPAPSVPCDWIPLRDDELLAWLPEDHPYAHADAYPLSRLATDPFIITMAGEDTDIDRLFEEQHIEADIRFSTKDAYTTWRMVEAGLGISLNNALISKRWDGAVATIPFDPPQSISLGIAVPELAEASPAAKAFISCAQEVLKDQ